MQRVGCANGSITFLHFFFRLPKFIQPHCEAADFCLLPTGRVPVELVLTEEIKVHT
jgi:hypothetical protein